MPGGADERAYPLADAQLSRRVLDAVKQAREFGQLRKGPNEAAKTLNRGVAQFIVLAADCRPLDVLLHLPLLCEDKGVPYLFVPRMDELGRAAGVTRDVSAVAVIISEGGQVRRLLEPLMADCIRML
eukprot:TRINITY_DN46942_c0_g1_i1.p1 TRINITY_DN46942_c0_g1~~TRINITY_DN46942_c0_g1_i1.p1  ORF type:complete len:127 (+),score=39.31 TRINITY_DN46942_c0_g1_i1:72-452(+)